MSSQNVLGTLGLCMGIPYMACGYGMRVRGVQVLQSISVGDFPVGADRLPSHIEHPNQVLVQHHRWQVVDMTGLSDLFRQALEILVAVCPIVLGVAELN